MKIKKTNKQYNQIELDYLKKQLNIDLDYTDEDSYLESLLEASIDYCETFLGSDIVKTDNEVTFKEFNSNSVSIYESFFNEITSIYIDNKKITDFEIDEYLIKFNISFDSNLKGDLKIKFRTGNETIKPKHKQAILIKASDLYDAERQSYNYNVNHNDNVLKFLLTL
ncbi:MAG: head-tail connector protein [bacterium]